MRSSCMAEEAVSSPPMVINPEMLSFCREANVVSRSFGSFVGLAREVLRNDPPRK